MNPRDNVSAITLRSGKHVEIPPSPSSKPSNSQATKQEKPMPTNLPSQNEPLPLPKHPITVPLPFPHGVTQSKSKEETNKEILEAFMKVVVNIPLLEAIM